MDNLSVINGASAETSDRVFFNSLFITGGVLQAENIVQIIGKAKTNPFEKFARFIKKLFPPVDVKKEHETHDSVEERAVGRGIENRISNNEQRMMNVEGEAIVDDSEVKESPHMVAASFSLRDKDVTAGFLPDYFIQAGHNSTLLASLTPVSLNLSANINDSDVIIQPTAERVGPR